MNRDLRSKIDRLAEAGREWGHDEDRPATSAEIEEVAEWFTGHHNQALPTQLREFWEVTNGAGMDGYMLLGAADANELGGVIGFNELYVEEFPEFFFLGTCDDIDMYAYHPESKKYQILFMFAFENVEAEFDTFDELAGEVLTRAMRRAKLL